MNELMLKLINDKKCKCISKEQVEKIKKVLKNES